MNTSVTTKKQCATCNKPGGIMTCDGCQQSFCGKHSNEHRRELANNLDETMQEYDLFQQELGQPSMKKSPLFQEIDDWEKEAIVKIQTAAATARKTLQELLEQSKEQLLKTGRNVAEGLRSSREAEDFSEHDLDRWRKQLKELQLEITFPSAAKLILDKKARIYLIALKTNQPSDNQFASKNASSSTSGSPNMVFQERFWETLGSVSIKEEGHLVTHSGSTAKYAYVRGRFLYSTGCHTIRFRLEKSTLPYCIFFGCMSSQSALTEDAFRSESSVGWFGFNQVYEQGLCSSNCKKHGYNSSKILTNHILHLTLDCDGKQIRLFHERSKIENILKVNIDKTPYPWQLLVALFHKDDCVRILPPL